MIEGLTPDLDPDPEPYPQHVLNPDPAIIDQHPDPDPDLRSLSR